MSQVQAIVIKAVLIKVVSRESKVPVFAQFLVEWLMLIDDLGGVHLDEAGADICEQCDAN